MTTAALLGKAWEQISDPKRWCQKWYAETASGRPIGKVRVVKDDIARNPRAAKWCAVGAIGKTVPISRRKKVRAVLERAADQLFHLGAAQVNDDRGHDAVRQMYQRAIALAEAEEASLTGAPGR